MRLLNVDTLELSEFANDQAPHYVAASHRWISAGETTYKDVLKKRNGNSPGYKKVEAFATYIREQVPSIKWLWIDTCCINKDSAAELSEAVNLMFEWYRNSHICIAYLADAVDADDFGKSEWFKRGWTLQELLAPRTLVFVSKTWDMIGFKGVPSRSTSLGRNLDQDVQRITGIPMKALSDFNTSQAFSVDERLRWMDDRTTTREEDMSYALYGIFGVAPGANYGERQAGARTRLLTAIVQIQATDKTGNKSSTSPEEPRRGSMHPATFRYLRRVLKDRGAASGWTLVDEFDPPDNAVAHMRDFAGGTSMAEYPGDPTTKLYLTFPSCEGDNRADWTVVAPNATFYPGEHRGHLIFSKDFPFRPPSVYWDTPLLNPFPRDGRFSGDIDLIWSPAGQSIMSVVTTMASLILRAPHEVEKSTLQGDFILHPLPKNGPGGRYVGDLLTGEGADWFRRCTQFFCRAFNSVHDDDEEVDQVNPFVLITDHHREMSCQAIEDFIDHIMVKFLKLEPPFKSDGLTAREYFADVDTMTAWVAAERRWARMLDHVSGCIVSQDRGQGDRNALYHM